MLISLERESPDSFFLPTPHSHLTALTTPPPPLFNPSLPHPGGARARASAKFEDILQTESPKKVSLLPHKTHKDLVLT